MRQKLDSILRSKLKLKLQAHWPNILATSQWEARRIGIPNLLANWQIKQAKIQRLSGGTDSPTWLIKTKTNKYVLQNLGSDRDWCDWLVAALKIFTDSPTSFPYKTPRLIPHRRGAPYIYHNGSYWWLYQFIEGKTTGFFIPADIAAVQVGNLVAAFHKTVRSMSYKHHRCGGDTLYNMARIEIEAQKLQQQMLTSKHLLSTFITQKLDYFLRAYRQITSIELRRIAALEQHPIYCDFHGNNILWDNQQIKGLIDFDALTIGSYLIDIQSALFYTASHEQGMHPDRITSLIQGYLSISPISSSHLMLIYPVMLEKVLCSLLQFLQGKSIDYKLLDDLQYCRYIAVLDWLITSSKEFEQCLLTASQILLVT
jgi:Ser/Thr protein kinase RdoA (MazF antagonist)